MTPGGDPKSAIRDRALALGFDAVGFAGPDTGGAGENLSDFIAQGFHGDMGWMKETETRRRSPRDLWPEVKSVVAVGVNYGPAEDPLTLHSFPSRGAVSVYARGRDYHDVLKKNLRRAGGGHRRRLGVRRQAIRRYRAGDGKAAGPGRGARLAGKAYESGIARVRLLAVPG